MNNESAYNLIDEPWIPVIKQDGTNQKVSLGEIFSDEGGHIADLALNPYERVAVFRLLLCVAQAALGPDRLKDESGWLAVRRDIGPVATDYLKKWHDRFFLYGPHAFLQPDDIISASSNGTTPCDKLNFKLASGNNSTFYDHAAGTHRVHCDSSLALSFISFQNFSSGGLSGICLWSGASTDRSIKGAPCREQSMLFSLLLGSSLIESLWMNLLTVKAVKELLSTDWGKPAWELESLSREDAACLSSSFLGHLSPLSRVVKFTHGAAECILGGGVTYPQLPEWREAMATIKPNRDNKPSYVSVDPSRMPWRDLSSILAIRGTGGRKSAIALRHLDSLPEKTTFTLWTGGLYSEKAKEIATVEWKIQLSVAMLEETCLMSYENAIGLSDKQRSCLYFAVAEYSKLMFVDSVARFSEPAERAYWDILAQPENQKLVQDVDSPVYLERWKHATWNAAKEAYQRACPAKTARQMEAFAQGFSKLTIREEN